MKRIWLNILWFGYWKWRTPRNREEMRRKIEVFCTPQKPYTPEQLRTAERWRTNVNFGERL